MPKKLIEVSLPLEAINKESAREIHPPRTPLHAAPVAGMPKTAEDAAKANP
jgi:adenine-specific DNA methylase